MEIILTEPRGFCAGVRRAIEIVEKAIEMFGIPIYVKHEIVHNKFVIENFQKQGVIFTDDISIVPEGGVIIYSAHGVSDAIEMQVKNLKLMPIDATCPLVQKVHKEVLFYEERDYEIILVGHRNHPEIEGTAGRLKNPVIIVETPEDARTILVKNENKVAVATQTTLSLDDTREIIDILQKRFPILKENYKNDICYATQNRQDAVKTLIKEYKITHLIVVGAKNSSNSNRLMDIGVKHDITSFLIDTSDDLLEYPFPENAIIGLTAGASAPEILVKNVISSLCSKFGEVKLTYMEGIKESVLFHLPKEVRTKQATRF